MRLISIVVIGLALFGRTIFAQDSASTKIDPEVEKVRAILDRGTDEFACYPSSDQVTALQRKPVMHWTNNERDSTSVGTLIFWIDGGVPVASIATYTWAGKMHHEFDQMSRQPVVVKQDDKTIWQPKEGVKFKPIPDAPAVESTRPARLRQMKQLSEQFSATMMGWRADKSDRAELRRLPRELYRYEPEKSDVIDGAAFCFAVGNDPEVILLLEAVKESTQSTWNYAFVRQTTGELQGRHLDQVVWSHPRYDFHPDPQARFLTITSHVDLKAAMSK